MLAQFISLLPVYGVMDSDYRKLRFESKSWKVCYSMGVIALNITFGLFSLNRYVRYQKVAFNELGDLVFLVSTFLISISFLILGMRWKDLIGKWAALQCEMSNFESSTVRKKIKLLTICLTLSTFFEHLLLSSQYLEDKSHEDDLRKFLDDGNISSVVGYSVWLGFFVYTGNFLLTFVWNYLDIFLTAISLSLANMFKQFNKDLKMTAATVSNENAVSYWRKKRALYNSISLLAKSVENEISHLVLISFVVNIYFICIQLLHSIQRFTTLLKLAYFCGSFGHILFRTCSVCFAATSIYEHSKGSLPLLYSVPSELYNSEVQRLADQITSETLALTGCNFFTVNRSLMLTIASTIVTYEVVLVQFNNVFDENGCAKNDSISS